ncbi:unnamed protein product [Lactuca saligna]|uniref:SecA family profile domain-containing protein n=1 Tax=Lactuca saligna TaxID=75948 RepID=A0AA35Z7E9_LACSI|nr:unnamed protein product [Lactuca saligna]
MEDRLKEDILLEAARWSNSGSMGASHTDSVKTSLQVYLEIQTRKFLVDYERIPATDEKSPKEHDFDTLVDRISRADLKTEIIFNCQMGHGRITTGMVIATLIYLNRIGASGLGRPVFWHNMREEPVIYINGKPFLLREVERPYKNMLEYTGIYCERVERMEARLKEDILKEPERYGCKGRPKGRASWAVAQGNNIPRGIRYCPTLMGHHYVLLPRATYFFGPALGPCIAIAYLSVLKDCEIHCFHEGLEVKRLGGLHVIGTSLHESRRIDNQLRGRAGRQGDPGSTRFMVRTVRFIAFMKDWKSNDLVVSMSSGHLCMSPEELIISFVAEQEGKEILDQHASWSGKFT